MKKTNGFILLSLFAVSLVSCNANTTSENNDVSKDVFDTNPYYLATCHQEQKEGTSEYYFAYSLYKFDFNSEKTFSKSEFSMIYFNDSDEASLATKRLDSITIGIVYDGTDLIEYYFDFSKGDSSKILKEKSSPLIVGDTAYPPYGTSGYYEGSYYGYDNMRLKDYFAIDGEAIYSPNLPNGAYFVKEAYAKSHNYAIKEMK